MYDAILPKDHRLEEIEAPLQLKKMAAAYQLQRSDNPEERATGKLLEAIFREQLKAKKKGP